MRRAGTLGALLGIVVLLSLSSCRTLFPSQLTASPSNLALDASNRSALITLSSTSNTTVAWTAKISDTQHVGVSPTSGSISPGSSAGVVVTVDYYGLSEGQTISPTVTFDGGSAGTATLRVGFTMTIGGLAQCGTLPSTMSVARAPAGPRAAAKPARAVLPDGRAYVPGELLVAYAAGIGTQGTGGKGAGLANMAAAVKADYGLEVLRAGGSGAPDLVRVSDARAALAKLRGDPRVRDAELNFYLDPLLTPNDTDYGSSQWTMQEFGMEQAWNTETGSSNRTVVAVIDDGVQLDHPDLAGKMIGGCDLNLGDNDPSPGPGQNHGTHVAGIAAAIGNNNLGVAGVAFGPNVLIEPVKIFDDTGNGATIDILINAIRWAAGLPVSGVKTNTNPADVINMSVGVAGTSKFVNQAATDAFNAGSLLVAAAGNHDAGVTDPTLLAVTLPGNAPDVVAVGSVDSDYSLSYFSNIDEGTQNLGDGTGVELMAPGGFEVSGAFAATSLCSSGGNVTILSTVTGSTYGCEAGTSMASPFVAGIAALLKSQNTGRSPTDLRSALESAVMPGSAPDPSKYGYGVVCADLALDPASTTTCGQ